jgi:chorismate-pyruvate lyase
LIGEGCEREETEERKEIAVQEFEPLHAGFRATFGNAARFLARKLLVRPRSQGDTDVDSE